MEWSDLRIFLASAREGTLGAAARKIGQTQPTMGRRLRALEQALGQTLFQRTADGFVLTDEGTAVLAHAERIEEEAIALQRQATGTETQLDGTLRLSSSDWFGTLMLSPVIAAFGKRHPKVIVELLPTRGSTACRGAKLTSSFASSHSMSPRSFPESCFTFPMRSTARRAVRHRAPVTAAASAS